MSADATTNVEVSATEIARLAGVGRAAVSNWRRRHATFPEPVGGTTTSPSFNLRDVERWLRDNGKLGNVDSADRLWHAVNPDRSPQAAADAFTHAAVIVMAMRANPESPIDLATDLATLRSNLPEALQPLLADLPEHTTQLAVEVARDTADEPGEIIDRLYQQFVRSMSRHVLATPEPLATLMVELANYTDGTVFDPACGAGELLLAASKAATGEATVVGQEIDVSLANAALVRLHATGVQAQIGVGDSLADDAWPDLQADVAVSHPPFGLRDMADDWIGDEARWPYGVPTRTVLELAWVQHVLAHLKPRGIGVVVLPPGVNVRRAGRRIRAELVRRGALQAVVALPAGALHAMGLSPTLWVLRRPDEGDRADEVLFVDAMPDTSAPNASRGGMFDVNWSDVTDVVLPAVRAHLEGQPVPDSQRSVLVPAIDLLDEDVDLSVVRHIEPPVTPVDPAKVEEVRSALRHTLDGLDGLIPTVAAVESPQTPATTTVAELLRNGAVTLHQHVGRVSDDSSDDLIPMLSGRDVSSGSEASGHVPGPDPSLIELREHDVVLVALGSHIRTRVIASSGAVLGPGLYLLRPDVELIDPWFLAFALRTSSNVRFTSTSGTSLRVEVRRLELPRLPIDEQQAMGAAFRRLASLEQSIAEATRQSRELSRLFTDGLTSGTVTVSE